MHTAVDLLKRPARLYRRDDVLGKPSPVPRAPGVYAWYFDVVPPGVLTEGCHTTDACVLLYVGTAPKRPPANGRPASRQSLRSRVRYHYRGNAAGSTLRLTLGCHLTEALGIALRRVGSGTRLTFTPTGEQRLSEWMGMHARVTWVEHPRPWEPEADAMHRLNLPLNIRDNAHNAYASTLTALRATHRAAARALPTA